MHNIKKEYVKNCTLLGKLGISYKFFIQTYNILAVLFIILLPLFIIANYWISAITFICIMILFLFTFLYLRKLKIKKIFNYKIKLFKSSDKFINSKLEDEFSELIKKYNLDKNTSKLDFFIKSSYKYAEKTKYTFLFERAIIGALLLPVWSHIVDYIFKYNNSLDQILSILLPIVILILTIIIPLRATTSPFLKELFNFETNEFYELATKLEEWKYTNNII